MKAHQSKKEKRWNIKKEIIVTFSFLLRTEIASLSLPVFICPSDKLFNRASRALTLLILNRLHFPCSVDQRHSNPSFPDVTFATVIFYTWYMLLASMNFFFFYEDKIFVMVVSSIQDCWGGVRIVRKSLNRVLSPCRGFFRPI